MEFHLNVLTGIKSACLRTNWRRPGSGSRRKGRSACDAEE